MKSKKKIVYEVGRDNIFLDIDELCSLVETMNECVKNQEFKKASEVYTKFLGTKTR